MTVGEGLGARTPLAADLATGVDAISSNQTVKFTKYLRLVLPLDGYVFWVKADLVAKSKSASPNATESNASVANAGPDPNPDTPTREYEGSLHYATDNKQQADSSYAVNRVVFTSLDPINEFEDVGPNVLWIAKFKDIRFAFSSRKSFYKQADLHHYVGDAVYPVLASMLIDKVEDFSARQIVSNSIPLWLAMNAFDPQSSPWVQFAKPPTLYPAFLAPENFAGAFGTIDVPPETRAIQSAPLLGRRLRHDQLVGERVKITLWQLDNDAAMDFLDFVNQWTLDERTFGLSSSPVVKDERFNQVELGAIARKKTIEYDINYYQQSARDVARQLILNVVPTFLYYN